MQSFGPDVVASLFIVTTLWSQALYHPLYPLIGWTSLVLIHQHVIKHVCETSIHETIQQFGVGVCLVCILIQRF